MKKIISLGLISIIYSMNIVANEIKILDFDVGGVKLKMDPKTVIATLKSTYSLKDEDILILKGSAWGKTYKKDMDLSKVSTIKQAERGISPDFYIGFCISEENNESEVRSVEYGIPDTKENRKKMYDLSVKKYGQPTFSSYSKTTHTWCDENKKTRIIGTTYTCTKKDPRRMLNLRSSSIALSSNECMLNNIKILEKRKNTTPKF